MTKTIWNYLSTMFGRGHENEAVGVEDKSTIPAFLSKFKDEIEKYKLDYIKITAKPLEEGETGGIQESKFLGKPFLPLDFPYPKSKSGIPMIMLAQINFAEIPLLDCYPTEGILQLFVSPTDWYDMEDYSILFHPQIECEHQTDFSFLTDDFYDESPIYVQHKLEFRKTVSYGGTSDVRFDPCFDGQSFYDYMDTLPKAEQTEMEAFFASEGHKIGGYAYFTQTDPRKIAKEQQNDVLILQIDTDEQIMFGDSGVANVFLNATDLKNKNFSKAYFNWDCC